MVKHTQFADELFECVEDHFVGLTLEGLTTNDYKRNIDVLNPPILVIITKDCVFIFFSCFLIKCRYYTI